MLEDLYKVRFELDARAGAYTLRCIFVEQQPAFRVPPGAAYYESRREMERRFRNTDLGIVSLPDFPSEWLINTTDLRILGFKFVI